MYGLLRGGVAELSDFPDKDNTGQIKGFFCQENITAIPKNYLVGFFGHQSTENLTET